MVEYTYKGELWVEWMSYVQLKADEQKWGDPAFEPARTYNKMQQYWRTSFVWFPSDKQGTNTGIHIDEFARQVHVLAWTGRDETFKEVKLVTNRFPTLGEVDTLLRLAWDIE